LLSTVSWGKATMQIRKGWFSQDTWRLAGNSQCVQCHLLTCRAFVQCKAVQLCWAAQPKLSAKQEKPLSLSIEKQVPYTHQQFLFTNILGFSTKPRASASVLHGPQPKVPIISDSRFIVSLSFFSLWRGLGKAGLTSKHMCVSPMQFLPQEWLSGTQILVDVGLAECACHSQKCQRSVYAEHLL
jgi:hypothetical protein